MAYEWVKGTFAGLLLASLLYVVIRVPAWEKDTPAQESMDGIAQNLFTQPWVFAFELLSILLLAALIGALYLATKTQPEEDSP